MSENKMNDIHLRIQALVDNELPEDQIDGVLSAIQDSEEYRSEYAELLRLRRQVGTGTLHQIPDEWLAKAERRITRRLGRGVGLVLFVGSYVALIGYSIYTMFREPDVPLILSVLITTLVAGVVFLLGNAIADRVRESKTDKYRGVIR